MQKETQKTIKTHFPIYIKKIYQTRLAPLWKVNGCNTNICIGFRFTGCAPLALCICTGCTQRYPSHYPPSEAHPPFLQTEDSFGHSLFIPFNTYWSSFLQMVVCNSPVTPSGLIVYSLRVKPFSNA